MELRVRAVKKWALALAIAVDGIGALTAGMLIGHHGPPWHTGLAFLISGLVGCGFWTRGRALRSGDAYIRSLEKARALDAKHIATLDKLIETQQEALRQMDALIMEHIPGAPSLFFPRKPDGTELN